MFTLGIRYLNGWSMAAADGAHKVRAEWPPHPDRVFMALAAAWFETDGGRAECEALRWLEALPPPGIAASDATERSSGHSYVPVNDAKVGRTIPDGLALLRQKGYTKKLDRLKEAGLAVLPEHRSRQPRGFPVALPHDPTVHLVWSGSPSATHVRALERLTAKVTHIGHSASFVQAWVEPRHDITPTWEPTEGPAAHRLRVPWCGRLDALERSFPRRPRPGRWQGYGSVKKLATRSMGGSVFDPRLLVFALRGRRLPLQSTLKMTEAMRGLLMKECDAQPPPEWFSGHHVDGRPSAMPHLAIAPLPFVGAEHADGRVMGLAVILPMGIDESSAGRCLAPILFDPNTGLTREHRLFAGRWLECGLEHDTRERPPWSLDTTAWVGGNRGSRVWASVTPVVLNRHFKGPDMWTRAAESLKDACGHIGLPRPRAARMHPASLVRGAPHAPAFPRLVRKHGGGRRSHNHAVLEFDQPVRGPVLLGAGRFKGYGLFRPMGPVA